MRRLVVTFCTGRCGTALLAQYFGGIAHSRLTWRRQGQHLVSHEPFDEDPRYWATIGEARRGGDLSEVQNLLNQALADQGDCDRCLIADNKLGRWFGEYFVGHHLPVRIIYLSRRPDDVIRSLKLRSPQEADRHWMYSPTDDASLSSLTDPYEFHLQETELRWQALKLRLPQVECFELHYEQFCARAAVRAELSQFIGIRGNEPLLMRRTNAAQDGFVI